jgi:hypothetical protein
MGRPDTAIGQNGFEIADKIAHRVRASGGVRSARAAEVDDNGSTGAGQRAVLPAPLPSPQSQLAEQHDRRRVGVFAGLTVMDLTAVGVGVWHTCCREPTLEKLPIPRS